MNAVALTPASRTAVRAIPWALVLLLLARLMLGFVYSVLNPLGEAPDEADHYAFASYIGREQRLPEGPLQLPGGPAWMTQAKHPPLYHTLAALAAGTTGMDFSFLRSNPDVSLAPGAQAGNFFIHTGAEGWPWRGGALAMHLGRSVSVLAGLILVAITYALGRAVWPSRPAVALAGAAVVAFLPESLFIGGSMSNDMLAALFAGLALWLGLRSTTWPRALATGLCMGLAFLSKVSTASLWPVIGLAILLTPTRQPSQGRAYGSRAALLRALLACGVALLLASPWLLRNWRVFGDPLGMRVVLATVDQRQGALTLADLGWLARGWFLSFFGRFGGAGHLALPAPLYWLWGGLCILAVTGWLRQGVHAQRRRQGLPGEISLPSLVVLLGAPVMTALSIVSYRAIALGTDQGRLLFPALAPLALLLAGGWAAWLPGNRRAWLPGLTAAVMATAAIVALVLGILAPFSAPPAPSAAEVAAALPIGEALQAGPELVALRWEAPAAETASAQLTLYWRTQARLSQDLRTALRLSDENGNPVWEWKRSPAAGRESTDRWQPEELVSDSYRIPLDALARAKQVTLGVLRVSYGNSPGMEERTVVDPAHGTAMKSAGLPSAVDLGAGVRWRNPRPGARRLTRLQGLWLRGFWPLLALVLVVPALQPLWQPGLQQTDDGMHHLFRLFNLDLAVRSGQFGARWLAAEGFGYGFPILNFYAPLSYYVGIVFHWLGAGFASSLEWTLALGLFTAALAMYLFARELLGDWGAALAAVAYTWAPYHLADTWTRGSLAEQLAFAWLPLLLLAMLRITRTPNGEPRRRARLWPVLWGSLAFAGLMLTHNVTTILAAPLLAGWGAFLLIVEAPDRQARRRCLGACLAMAALGLLLSAAFWLPALAEVKSVRAGQAPETFDIVSARLDPPQCLVSETWAQRYTTLQQACILHPLGQAQLALAVLGMAGAAWRWRRLTRTARLALPLFVGLALFGLFMQSEPSRPLWRLPGMVLLLNPWRWQTLSALMLALVSGYAGYAAQSQASDFSSLQRIWRLAGQAAVVLILALALMSGALPGIPWETARYPTTQNSGQRRQCLAKQHGHVRLRAWAMDT